MIFLQDECEYCPCGLGLCGFSFAEDNQYVLVPNKTKYVSRIKQVFRDFWIASSKERHFYAESEVVYPNACKFL